MSEKKEPQVPKEKVDFSRRGFLKGVGIGGGVLSTGLLEPEAEAATSAKVDGPGAVPITLNINGKPHRLSLEPRVTLCDALRNHLEYTGAKRVCDRGTCGACTVIVAGKAVYGCTMLAIDAQGKHIETLEGISKPAHPHPVTKPSSTTTPSSAATARPASSWPRKPSSTIIPIRRTTKFKHGPRRQSLPLRHLCGHSQGRARSRQEMKGGANA